MCNIFSTFVAIKEKLRMNYSETINYMFNQLPMYQRQGKAAYKADLETSIEFDKYLNHPHTEYKTIHVAGTNGKGSVSHILSSVLQEAGYKVGLYTSPHLKSFRERIKVNGEDVSEQFIIDFIENIKAFIEEQRPSFFEMTVFMALQYFKIQKVDIAIIEVGMGGRLDSTNVINPILSVITNISLDHTAFLGDTVSKIAIEKAGIIKKEVPVVIGESHPESKPVFIEKAKEKETAIYFAEEKYQIEYAMHNSYTSQTFNVKSQENTVYENLQLDLLGAYQSKNIISVLTVVDILNKKGININKDVLYKGVSSVVKNTNLLGRWQILGNNPLTICDTGHNEAGIIQIIAQLKQIPYKKLHFVIGTVNDKNISSILSLLPKDAVYYFTKANIERALNVDSLYKEARKHNLSGEKYQTVEQAYQKAKQNADKNDLIFIGGSTFVVAEIV